MRHASKRHVKGETLYAVCTDLKSGGSQQGLGTKRELHLRCSSRTTGSVFHHSLRLRYCPCWNGQFIPAPFLIRICRPMPIPWQLPLPRPPHQPIPCPPQPPIPWHIPAPQGPSHEPSVMPGHSVDVAGLSADLAILARFRFCQPAAPTRPAKTRPMTMVERNTRLFTCFSLHECVLLCSFITAVFGPGTLTFTS